MSLLSSRTKAVIRQTIERAMVDALIRRKEFGVDSMGARTVLPSVDYPTKVFMARATRTGSDMVAAADSGRVYYMANLPHDAVIQDGDTLVVEGLEYETVQVLERHSNDVMIQALVVKAGS